MSNLLSTLLDPYNRKARFQPVVLGLLPILVSSVLLIPGFQAVWTDAAWLLICGGGPAFLTQLGRSRGKTLEPVLYRLWGGKPSVAMLRHRDGRLATSTKARYRDFLERTVPELRLASPAHERLFPERADDGYEGATSWLLTQTRDHQKFALLFQENVNYGFRRNIWGLKPFALTSALLTVAMVLGLKSDVWFSGHDGVLSTVDVADWVAIAVAVAHIFVFTFLIRRDWVRTAADAYALQLLASCDMLESRKQP